MPELRGWCLRPEADFTAVREQVGALFVGLAGLGVFFGSIFYLVWSSAA